MQILSDSVAYINNLPPTKKLILLIILFIVILFIIDTVSLYMKQNFRNITNHSIENMEGEYTPSSGPSSSPSSSPSSGEEDITSLPYRDIMINTEVLNITLFYADWCGHCKKFMNETWGQMKEKFDDKSSVQLNQIDCTNIKEAITTPAGKSIEGFPTLILNYKDENGKYVEEEYHGPRSVEVLSSIIDKFTGSSTPTNKSK